MSLTWIQDNVCVDAFGHAVVVDYDSCLAFGEPIMKGQAGRSLVSEKPPLSDRENDMKGLLDIEHFLFPSGTIPAEHADGPGELTPKGHEEEHE